MGRALTFIAMVTAVASPLCFGMRPDCAATSKAAASDLLLFDMRDVTHISGDIADSGSAHVGVYEITLPAGKFALKTTWGPRDAESVALQNELADRGFTPRLYGFVSGTSLREAADRFRAVDAGALPDQMVEGQVMQTLGKVWNVTHSHHPLPEHAAKWDREKIVARLDEIERYLVERKIHLDDPQIAITEAGVPYLIDIDGGSTRGFAPVKPLDHVRQRFLAKWAARFETAPKYVTAIAKEKRLRELGFGASGKVYLWETTLPDGTKIQTVKKTLKLERGETKADLKTKVRAYDLAAKLGLGPEVVAAVAKGGTFRQPLIDVSLRYLPGVPLSAEWPRNNLPRTLEEARAKFGNYVLLNRAFANTTPLDYVHLRMKAAYLHDIHPDPTNENIRFVSRIVDGKERLDIIAVDWEDSAPGRINKLVQDLEVETARRALPH